VLHQADEEGTTFGETKVERGGETVLDCIHQSINLLRRPPGRCETIFVEDVASCDQSSGISRKPWIEGVLARSGWDHENHVFRRDRHVFKGIAPLSWRRNESWACAEAKEALQRLAPEDSEDIWRNHKDGEPQTRAQQSQHD